MSQEGHLHWLSKKDVVVLIQWQTSYSSHYEGTIWFFETSFSTVYLPFSICYISSVLIILGEVDTFGELLLDLEGVAFFFTIFNCRIILINFQQI